MKANYSNREFPKSRTGIKGLDEITNGGLPKGRPTLVCGGAGCGKTLLAMEFLVRGATRYSEPGVFLAFEETAEELTMNVASLGFNLADLMAQRKLHIDCVQIERSEIEETGEFDLDGLFVRLGHAIDSIGAKRVALDTLESLFVSLPNEMIIRAELRRLFRWLKDKGVTALITAERGAGTLTRYGLEEYVSDCVIVLDHRVVDQISTRRLRVVKYRGSLHGTNEYPFLIGEEGIVVQPVTSLGLNNKASNERISSGVSRLDNMLGERGFYRGSSVLVSGPAGTGKTSLVAHIVNAACERGERCLYFAFEESTSQLIRNMSSIGIDLQRWVTKNLLKFHASRPTAYGLETHLAMMRKLVTEFRPSVVTVDSITNLIYVASAVDVHAALMQLIDSLKNDQITCLLTSVTETSTARKHTVVSISSLIDSWIVLRDIESTGERNRGIQVLKSRGMAHSNQIREFRITSAGLQLSDVDAGSAGVLTGTARVGQEKEDKTEAIARQLGRKQREIARKKRVLDGRIAALQAEFIAALQAEFEEEKEEL